MAIRFLLKILEKFEVKQRKIWKYSLLEELSFASYFQQTEKWIYLFFNKSI